MAVTSDAATGTWGRKEFKASSREQHPGDITAHCAPCVEPRHFRSSGQHLGGANRRGIPAPLAIRQVSLRRAYLRLNHGVTHEPIPLHQRSQEAIGLITTLQRGQRQCPVAVSVKVDAA